jgi:GTP-binding protein
LQKKAKITNFNKISSIDMQIRAKYVSSHNKLELCPKDERPEFAFIGRSNVGKSSLINCLCQQKDMARVSQTPGKTQTLNFYDVNEQWYLVDLPGYGYARTSKKNRAAFGEMITDYLADREQLFCAFLLIDSNISPQKIDLEFIDFLGEYQVPFVIAFTKIDRLTKTQIKNNIDAFNAKLSESWETLPQQFLTSAQYKNGREEVLEFIQQTIKNS